jgi:4-diphosphocytidyl-2-C-methyl-D-erythritol kinase
VKLVARAPGKVNLCLFIGPVRADGRHELVTVFQSLSLADDIAIAVGGATDEVVCPGVDGPNLAAEALAELRARGWDAPAVRVAIDKRVPVAAGMGGGSADAAAVLRLATALGSLPGGATVLSELAASLGSDVPSQLRPGLTLGTGAGDVVERLEPLAPHAFVIVPLPFGLSTAEVYREADRLGLPRSADELAERLASVRIALRPGAELPAELLVNDLEPAALSLRPVIADALAAVREAGAGHAMVSGSGPTVVGVYRGTDPSVRATAGAAALADRYPDASPAAPVTEDFGDPRGT